MADAALDRALRRRHRARHRDGRTPRSRRSISPSRAIPQGWAATLDGRVLATGTVRTIALGADPAAARLRRRRMVGAGRRRRLAGAACLGDVRGKTVADLCAAPGGKTAQLAQAGARSPRSTARRRAWSGVRQNLARLQLGAEIVTADAAAMARRAVRRRAGGCALLVDRHDPPPSRHPLAEVRRPTWPSSWRCRPACSTAPRRCSSRAACWSIAPARSNPRRARRRSRRCWPAIRRLRRSPIRADELAGHGELLTPQGELRTLPCYWAYDPEPRMGGLDGFYAARISDAGFGRLT